jgi:hypothetical protein
MPINMTYQVNEYVFTNEDAISFYLLGAYMTDGCISKIGNEISFSVKDNGWAADIRNIVCPTAPLPINKKGMTTFRFASQIVKDWFIRWGCTPAKSLTLKIEKQIPKQFIPDFLRGVVDGDGSVLFFTYEQKKNNKMYTCRKSRSAIYSASKNFIDQLLNIIPSSITPSVAINTPAGKINGSINGKQIIARVNTYAISVNDTTAAKFVNWIYYPNNPISLARKNITANEIINYHIEKNRDFSI